MSGKGSAPRPKSVPDEVFSNHWSGIDWTAREVAAAKAAGMTQKQAICELTILRENEELAREVWSSTGHSSTAEQDSLTVTVVSSNLTAPATYVDDATGQIVDEHFWPDPRNCNGPTLPSS